MDKKKIFLVSLGHLSCDINGGALPATLPYLRSALALDYQATSGLMLAYSCLSSLIQPLLGLLSDHFKKPWFIPLGVALAGIGLAVMGFMHNYWAIFAAIALSGVGSAFFHPEGARFANKVSGNSKGTGLSFFSIGGNSGFLLGPLLVTFFVGRFGLSGMSSFAVISLCMSTILIWQISRMGAGKNPAAAAFVESAEFSAADPAGAEGDELAEEVRAPEGKNNWPEFSKLTVVIICRSVIFVGVNSFIPFYWVNVFGQSAAAGAFALVFFNACGICCNILGGVLSDRHGCVNIIRTAFCLMPLAVLAFGLAGNIWIAWCILPCLGFVLYSPFSSQVVQGQKLLAKNIGFASGITLGLATTLGGVAQPGLGWLADKQGLRAVFFCLAAIALAGAVFSFLLSKKA